MSTAQTVASKCNATLAQNRARAAHARVLVDAEEALTTLTTWLDTSKESPCYELACCVCDSARVALFTFVRAWGRSSDGFLESTDLNRHQGALAGALQQAYEFLEASEAIEEDGDHKKELETFMRNVAARQKLVGKLQDADLSGSGDSVESFEQLLEECRP